MACRVSLVLVALAACSKSHSIKCGVGTVLRDGTCVGENGESAGSAIEARPAEMQSPPIAAEPAQPSWEPFHQTNKMDDSEVIGVRIAAVEQIDSVQGHRYRPWFWIGCDKNTTHAYFDFGTFVPSEVRSWESSEAYGYRSGVPVRVRIDRGSPISNFGNPTADGKGVDLSDPIAILKKMIGHDTVLIEFTPVNEAPKTVKFSIVGIDAALTEVRRACRW